MNNSYRRLLLTSQPWACSSTNGVSERRAYIRGSLYPRELISERAYIRASLYPRENISEEAHIRESLYTRELISERAYIRGSLYPRGVIASLLQLAAGADQVFFLYKLLYKTSKASKLYNKQKLIQCFWNRSQMGANISGRAYI